MAQPELNLPPRAIGRSGILTGEADIYNSNEIFWSCDRALSI
ncbi:MAG: hypothetical protein ABI262_20160 [Microcoleus sp.]